MTREEAINEIKSWDFLEGKEIEAIHTLIPELAESEDERIWEALYDFISDTLEDYLSDYGISKGEALAYLEKQKEQKHTLKFKVGDKVHLEGDDVNILTITGIEKDRYLTDNSYGPILFGAEDIWQIVEQNLAEDKEILKNILFQKKGITYDDYKCKNNPYVGLYFDELIKCLEEYDKERSNR